MVGAVAPVKRIARKTVSKSGAESGQETITVTRYTMDVAAGLPVIEANAGGAIAWFVNDCWFTLTCASLKEGTTAMPKAKAAPSTVRRPWSKDDIRTLKSLSHESAPVIARQLGRTVGAIYQQASKRSVHLGTVKRSAMKTVPKAAPKAAKKR